MGESIVPTSNAEGSRLRAKSRTAASVASCTAGSRITPRPLSTAVLPASNWGFTSATSTPPPRRSAQMAGSTAVSEMKDKSITITSNGLRGRSVATRWRALIFSRLVTLGSLRNRACSWARPTSTQTTSVAPACSAQSVNPPVEAPTSSTWVPRRSSAKRSRAAASFSPPRLTKRGGCSISIPISRGNSLPGLSNRSVPWRTRPLMIRALAWVRDSANPRTTSSSSSRSFLTGALMRDGAPVASAGVAWKPISAGPATSRWCGRRWSRAPGAGWFSGNGHPRSSGGETAMFGEYRR